MSKIDPVLGQLPQRGPHDRPDRLEWRLGDAEAPAPGLQHWRLQGLRIQEHLHRVSADRIGGNWGWVSSLGLPLPRPGIRHPRPHAALCQRQNGSSVDADGKIKLNTRRDFVLSSLGTKDAVAMMQQFCRKHVEHVWRVKKTSFFIARFDFLHFDAMAVFDDACDAALFGHSQTPPPPPPTCYMSGCPNRVSERWKPRVPCASAACTREQQSSRCQSIADHGDVDSVVDLLFEELVAEAADDQLPLPPPPPPPPCYMARCQNREKMSM